VAAGPDSERVVVSRKPSAKTGFWELSMRFWTDDRQYGRNPDRDIRIGNEKSACCQICTAATMLLLLTPCAVTGEQVALQRAA
jgi:hypothetical protein